MKPLTPDILADDQQLHALIDSLLTSEQTYWRFCRRICKLQLVHQALASDATFEAQLAVEEVLNERTNSMLATVARWAFEEGRRAAL